MAEQVIIPLNQSFVTPLGEPTGWEGPYETFDESLARTGGTVGASFNGYYPYAHWNGGVSNEQGWYFDIDDPAPVSGSPWKDHDGSDKGTETDPFQDVPPDSASTTQAALDCMEREDGTLFYVWGTQSGVAGKGCTFDQEANSAPDPTITGSSTFIYYKANTSGTDLSGENYAIAESGGVIYGFGGVSNNTGNAIPRVGIFDDTARDWALSSDDTTVAAAFGSDKRTAHFAITLPSGVIWVGGGTNQVSASTNDGNARHNTFYYDPSQPEGSRISAGPDLPDTATNVWFSTVRPVVLGNGEVYFMRNTSNGVPAGGPNRDTVIVDPETGDWRRPYDYGGDTVLCPAVCSLGSGSLYYGTNVQTIPDGRILFTENTLATYISTHD
jgi:hypothetical protein